MCYFKFALSQNKFLFYFYINVLRHKDNKKKDSDNDYDDDKNNIIISKRKYQNFLLISISNVRNFQQANCRNWDSSTSNECLELVMKLYFALSEIQTWQSLRLRRRD